MTESVYKPPISYDQKLDTQPTTSVTSANSFEQYYITNSDGNTVKVTVDNDFILTGLMISTVTAGPAGGICYSYLYINNVLILSIVNQNQDVGTLQYIPIPNWLLRMGWELKSIMTNDATHTITTCINFIGYNP
jgi:hypothetical protein